MRTRPQIRRKLRPVAQSTLASALQWCGSKGAYNRPSYPCHYCTYRGGRLRQGAVDKAKAETSVTQASASITTFRCVRRLAASSEKLFMTPPKMSQSLVAASRRKVQPLAPAGG